MPIVAGDILLKYSVVAASGNVTAGSAATSLGDQISTTTMPSASLHNLFDAISGAENVDGAVDYRCIFIHNNHATLAYTGVVVFLSAETAGGANAAISVDTTGVTPLNHGSAQAKTIANETTAPSGQTFTSPTTIGAGLAIGTIPAGSVAAVWVRRTAVNSPALSLDSVTISVAGDTAP